MNVTETLKFEIAIYNSSDDFSRVVLFCQGPRPTQNAFEAARIENGIGAILFLCGGFPCATVASGVVVNLCVNSSLSDHNTRIRNRLSPKIASSLSLALAAYENIPTSFHGCA
jgi:hypothetical protein